MRRITIRDEVIRERAVEAVASAPLNSLVLIREGDGRSSDQNAMFHAILSDISRQVPWHGKTLSVEIWKRLITAAYLREIGGQPMMVPALDGNGFDVIFERTSTMPMSRSAKMKPSDPAFNELVDWAQAFGDQNGVQWSARVAA